MLAEPLRFRQVHLDFHTSGLIPDIGARFDKARFQDALQTARVNSVNLFAKCHHGFSYHETRVGQRHPHLVRELLDEQLAACREIGVRTPIYVSAGFDELAADWHPEWVVGRRDGKPFNAEDPTAWRVMSFASPYLNYLCRQIEEVVNLWPDANDGIWLDIIAPWRDYSEAAVARMRAAGLDPDSVADVDNFARQVLFAYYEQSTAAARSRNPAMPVFHNEGHVPTGFYRRLTAYNSHLELESLPTGGWGYDHFPLVARHAATTGQDFLGMTGKFHTHWGEFGGYKRPAALRYECSAMLAMAAKCCVGDQLHPSGEINADTYALIGDAYREVEAREPWCREARPLADIALVSSDRDQGRPRRWDEPRSHAPDEGAARMLLEAHLPFLVLDDDTPWDGFRLVILPDAVSMTPALRERAEAFLADGGAILASGRSLLNEDDADFALTDSGLRLVGRSPFNPDYLAPTPGFEVGSIRSPLVIHGGAWDAEPLAGTEVLLSRSEPYFNRTGEHFCSHLHTPDRGPGPFPGATISRGGRLAWFAHEIFTRYRHYGQGIYRDFVLAAMRRLLGGKLPVETSLPSTGRVAVNTLPDGRIIVHLLHASPVLRGGVWSAAAGGDPAGSKAVEIIEELLPVHDVRVRLRLRDRKVSAARLVPSGEPLELVHEADGAVGFTVPRLEGHAMVEFR